jgi:hypothetical protein
MRKIIWKEVGKHMVVLMIKSEYTDLMVPNNVGVEDFFDMIQPTLKTAFEAAEFKCEINKDSIGMNRGRRADEVYFQLGVTLHEILYNQKRFTLSSGQPAYCDGISNIESSTIVDYTAKEFVKLDPAKLKLVMRITPKFERKFKKK